MIKILSLKENNEKYNPFFKLVITLGYGEHCNDTTTEDWLEINDEKAMKYESLSDEEMDEMDWADLNDISDCITMKKAEDIVKFINSLWERKDKNGYDINHIVINDGPDNCWWKDYGGMTDKEFEWFSDIYYKYHSLFNPKIEHNWCGIVGCEIQYLDENGKTHKCEVI